ncbi:MAG: phospholipase [Alphaproteobacteria bacterium CG_4_10_14_0_2_um_filter_63_37]|nr:MAG: hypothetical protein AUJ55_07110 [Proteobacteria bacterium CG1_02_64_396]PJA24099.1 MAG: phospholipase [Alphaproteobacteria bacterium CG_4_10_14_0_2_um_filter_63_37]
MIVVFVHGWGVTDTESYGLLPEALAAQAGGYGLEIAIEHIWLGRYINFHDEVSVADVARAFHRALHDQIPDGEGIAAFSCITHSTGGPVVREWLQRFYGAERLGQAPLRHLAMLAPANHGSALAALGKAKVGRLKAWFGGVEPGQRVLDWLCLGSRPQLDLATATLDYRFAESGVYPFVLTGQTIDKRFYDFLNTYLVEPGSDGVIRVAAANLNFSMIRLVETPERQAVKHGQDDLSVHLLKPEGPLRRPEPIALGVVPGASHSGDEKGIMRSVVSTNSSKPQVQEILQCLQVGTAPEYEARRQALEALTAQTQGNPKGHRYTMLVFVINDDQGDPIGDYDLFLLGGVEQDPGKLTKGFFVDRQQNGSHPNHLVYYVDYDRITQNKLTGFRLIARPDKGFAFYHAVEFRSDGIDLNSVLRPNETFYVAITLHRCVDQTTFRFDSASDPKLRSEGLIFKTKTRRNFKDEKPSGDEVDS